MDGHGLQRGGSRFPGGRLVLVLVVVLVALLVQGAQAASLSCGAGTCTVTFAYTGAAQTWAVPAGVTSATFDAFGAQGGSQFITSGGPGGEAKVTLAVTPGDSFEIVVGGAGAYGAAGFNGGGAAGAGDVASGAGGGGASDIRTGSCVATLSCSLASRLLVAGGGGGVSAGSGGGQGGYPSGGSGGSSILGAGGGSGGGQSAGGTVGSAGDGCGSPGGAGSLGQGGSGGSSSGAGATFGGGGGGGFYGGFGGGGGACYNNYAYGGGGGGGSSHGPNGTTFGASARNGDGLVTVSYAVAPATLNLWVRGTPSTALLDVKEALSIGGVAQTPATVFGVSGSGGGPQGSALATVSVPLMVPWATPGQKLRLELSARNSCTSPVNSANISLFFNTNAANSSLAFPAGPTLYLTGATGGNGALATGFSSLKLLTDTAGSAGKCGSYRPLGTFTSH